MVSFVVRRLAIGIVLIVLASFVSFVLVAVSGDPLSTLEAETPPPSPDVLAEQRHRLHIDESLLPRYVHWIGDVLQGRFGPSVNPTLHIGSEIRSRVVVTLQLVTLALIVAFILAVVAGVVGALRKSSRVDHSLTLVTFVLVSMPAFWFAILLKQAGVTLNHAMGGIVVYTIGARSPEVTPGFWNQFSDSARHMLLPTLTLALLVYGSWSRYQRAAMLDELSADYVQFARARGMPWRRVVLLHALRNALPPVITVAMTDIATILGGAVVIEEVFQWHGMGDLLVQAVTRHDVYTVASWLLVAGVVVVLANLVADVAGAVLDPATRSDRG